MTGKNAGNGGSGDLWEFVCYKNVESAKALITLEVLQFLCLEKQTACAFYVNGNDDKWIIIWSYMEKSTKI